MMVPPLPRQSPGHGLPIGLEDLVRIGLLLPTPAQAAFGLRRELRLPSFNFPRQPRPPLSRQVCWSGESRPVPIWARRGAAGRRLLGYCRRGDAWTSGAREAFG